MPNKTLKVGVVQQAVADNNKQTNWNKSAEQVAKLADEGCECILLQELHSTLYFCQQEDTDAFDLAEPIPGPATDFFGELAEKHNIVLVTSLFEKRGSGLYHNTAVVFDRSKEIAGKYRKMHIPDDPGFYEKFYFTPGDMGFQPICFTSMQNINERTSPIYHTNVMMSIADTFAIICLESIHDANERELVVRALSSTKKEKVSKSKLALPYKKEVIRFFPFTKCAKKFEVRLNASCLSEVIPLKQFRPLSTLKR